MDELREKVILGIGYSLVNDSIMECANAKCQFINCRESCLEWLLRNALTPLKAQEPELVSVKDSDGGETHWYVCGKCKALINPGDKYCHECGREVKWDD